MDVVLKVVGFEVVQAQNGFEAYELAAQALRSQKQGISKIVQNKGISHIQDSFDVIFLDLNMPISDGYEACKKINQLYESVKLIDQEKEANNLSGLVKDLKPLIIACSSDDITNPVIRRNLELAMFDDATLSPLSTVYLKGHILPMIDKNKLRIQRKFSLYQQISEQKSDKENSSMLSIDLISQALIEGKQSVGIGLPIIINLMNNVKLQVKSNQSIHIDNNSSLKFCHQNFSEVL